MKQRGKSVPIIIVASMTFTRHPATKALIWLYGKALLGGLSLALAIILLRCLGWF